MPWAVDQEILFLRIQAIENITIRAGRHIFSTKLSFSPIFSAC